MPRVRIAPGVQPGDRFALPRPEAHYVARVLRLRAGEEIDAFDGAGKSWRLRLLQVSPAGVEVEVLAAHPPREAPCTPLVLGQAVIKGANMDLIVVKGSELGLTTLVPLTTARTVVSVSGASQRLARWRRLAEAAARQCGRQTLLEVLPPMSLPQFCAAYRTAAVKMVCWENEPRRGLRHVLEAVQEASSVAVLIGPEGGFTAQEVAAAQAQGFVPVSLGPRVLRTETAAIVVTGIIRYGLRELEPREER